MSVLKSVLLTTITQQDFTKLRPSPRNARTHSRKQIKQIANSIERFGFTNPVLVDDGGLVIAGHGRIEAARLLGLKTVPTLAISHMSPSERRAYMLADNKIALNAGWDTELLALELQELADLDFDVELSGFSLAETDLIIEQAESANSARRDEPEDEMLFHSGPSISVHGDLWRLGEHLLICGDARLETTFAQLLGNETVDLVFTDPPYNVKIDGNVCGNGSVRHREFAFASGEMREDEFTYFLEVTLGHCARSLRDGGIAFVCMDWRHMRELLTAGAASFSELKNLVVWNKTNAGMGTFYRSKHELIFVFKQGRAEHTNTFGLGDTGRYRTNVWDYPGISSLSKDRADELAMHPTVKPVAMIADAIKDCSRRGEIVLDCFAGSGSTLIAAEQTGRLSRLVEFDPQYCDTIIRRWEKYTGRCAIHEESGKSFEDREETVGV